MTVFLGAGIATPVGAQLNPAAETVKVSPVRSDIEVQPGTSKDIAVNVTNIGQKPVILQVIQNDFVSADENGTPALMLDPNLVAPTHSLKKFMTSVSDVTVPAGETKAVTVTITVPQNAQAGGYFGAIRFVPVKKSGDGQVNFSASLSSIILLRVPGDTLEKLKLTHFDVHEKGDTIATQLFQNPQNLEVTARFENKGNVQVSPFGKVSVKKWSEVVYETDFNANEPRDMILPDGARKWNIPLDKAKDFGKYTVMATFTYGLDNKTIDIQTTFWVIPWKVVVWAGAGFGGFIGLLIIVRVIYAIRHHRRKLQLGGHRRRK